MFDKLKKRINDETTALEATNGQAKYVCSTMMEFREACDNNTIKDGDIAYITESDTVMARRKEGYYEIDKLPTVKDVYMNGRSLKSDISASISTSLDYEKIFEEMAKRFNKTPITEHKCHNCGGTVEIDADKHIFKCPYCKSVYAVGTLQVNAM